LGIALAAIQAWSFRFITTVDGIAYLDMSDATFRGFPWGRAIDGVWSPLYPLVLGIGRHLLRGAGEIQNAHYINVGIFVFSFACFEFLRRTIKSSTGGLRAASAWGFDVIAYALFLWASIVAITFKAIRPDMLMSGWLYLASGLTLAIRARADSWRNYILLGAVLGVGYLAKAPMLYIGLILIACTLNTRRLRETAPKAAAAAGILLLIGSLYFVPLSAKVGRFTFGQSSEYNYLGHIDQIGMYQETLGYAGGRFENAPRLLLAHPQVYSFDTGQSVTFPLRFEPARWVVGARPRFYLPSQITVIRENAVIYRTPLLELAGAIAGTLVLASGSRYRFRALLANWPLIIVGVAGLGMYLVVHVEERYVGAFFLLLLLGLMSGACAAVKMPEKLFAFLSAVIALSLLIPMVRDVTRDYRKYRTQPTGEWLQAANELSATGVRPGDKVARICDRFADLNWARQLRATVVSEVRFDRTDEFWSAPPEVQERALRAMADRGAGVVVAHPNKQYAPPESWRRLGQSGYYYRELTKVPAR